MFADVIAVVTRGVAVKCGNLDAFKAIDAADELTKRALLVLRERLGREDVQRCRVRVLFEGLYDRELVDERLAR